MLLLHVVVLCGQDNDDLSGFENAASILFLTLSCTIARTFLSKRRQKECVYASMQIFSTHKKHLQSAVDRITKQLPQIMVEYRIFWWMSTLVLVTMSSIAIYGKSSRREKRSDKELCQYGSAKPLDILGSFIAVGISLVKAEFIVIQENTVSF